MNLPKDKLTLIYYPFLFLSAACISIYTFLNWLLIIKLHLFHVKEDTINFWIPFALPWIPLLIWMRPRIKLLAFKRTAKNPVMGYLCLAGFAMIAPCIIAQEYIETATGKMTHLKNISDINSTAQTKYYSIDEYCVNNKQAASFLITRVSGKYNANLDLKFYIICPIYPDSTYISMSTDFEQAYSLFKNTKPLIVIDGIMTDSASIKNLLPSEISYISVLKGPATTVLYGSQGQHGVILVITKNSTGIELPKNNLSDDSLAKETTMITSAKPISKNWICFKFFKSISNRLSDDVTTARISDFKSESWKEFRETSMNGFTYFDRITNNDNLEGYEKTLNAKHYRAAETAIFLEPKKTLFSTRNGSKAQWIFGSFAIGAFAWLLAIFFTPLSEEKMNDFLNGVKKENETNSIKDLFIFFTPREKFYATPILIDLNILVFLAMLISGIGFISFSAKDLISWGANLGINTTDGGWWRLLTSMFVHGGILHLLMNMYALLFVGMFLEPVTNKKRFALFYLITGLCASFASAIIHPYTVSVGASGAIFGMYGIFIALLTTKVFPAALKKTFLLSTLAFVAYNLIIGFSMQGTIDNAAHLGGLISGIILGYISYPFIKKEQDEKVGTET